MAPAIVGRPLIVVAVAVCNPPPTPAEAGPRPAGEIQFGGRAANRSQATREGQKWPIRGADDDVTWAAFLRGPHSGRPLWPP